MEVLSVGIPLNAWTRKEAKYTAVLSEALRVVDNGKSRPSRPARTILQTTPAKKVPETRTPAAGLALTAYPLTASFDGVGEGFAGALPCSLANAKAGAGQALKEQEPGTPSRRNRPKRK